jgi:hypothetical protein
MFLDFSDARITECFGCGVFWIVIFFGIFGLYIYFHHRVLIICNVLLQMEMTISACFQGLQQLVKIIM